VWKPSAIKRILFMGSSGRLWTALVAGLLKFLAYSLKSSQRIDSLDLSELSDGS